MLTTVLDKMCNWWRVRLANRDGTAAIEFAFIFPVLLTVYLGSVEGTNAIIANRKVTNLTSTIADLAAQSTSVDDTILGFFFDAGNAVMSPYPITGLSMTISSVEIDAAGNTRVDWSAARNATPHALNATFPDLPAEIKTPGTFLIVAEVSYNYDSFLKYFIKQAITMNDVFYLRPRLSTKVTKL